MCSKDAEEIANSEDHESALFAQVFVPMLGLVIVRKIYWYCFWIPLGQQKFGRPDIVLHLLPIYWRIEDITGWLHRGIWQQGICYQKDNSDICGYSSEKVT